MRLRVLVLLSAVALVATACGDDESSTAAAPTTDAPTTTTAEAPPPDPDAPTTTTTEAPPPDPDEVNFMLDFFTFNGYHSAAHVADELGFFADENISVNILEGGGSSQTAQLTGEGEADFGMVVGSTIVDAVSQEIPIISVAQHLTFSGFCAIALPDSGITQPSEIRGKKLANPPFGASGPLLPAYLEGHGMTLDDVEVVSIGETVASVALIEGITDTWISTLFGFPVQFKEEFDIDALCFPFKDVDADPVGWGIVTRNDLVNNNPDLVERFVRAFLKGWKYTLDNPLEAGEITFERVPTTTEAETAVASIQMILDFEMAPFARDGLAFGEHDPADWENTLQLATEYLGLERVPTLDELFTNEFIPSAEALEG